MKSSSQKAKLLGIQVESVNADINGSLNILRRYMAAGDAKQCIPRLITSARDKGCADNPVRSGSYPVTGLRL